MNPAQIINLIPDIVTARESSATDKWILMIIDNKIQCVAADGEQHEGLPLMPITMSHVNNGFSGREWDRITNRIKAYQVQCPDFYAEALYSANPDKIEAEMKENREEKNVDTDTDTQ